MLRVLEQLLSRGPEAGSEGGKTLPAGQSRPDSRTAADQDRDDFEAESERLRSSNRIIGPGGG